MACIQDERVCDFFWNVSWGKYLIDEGLLFFRGCSFGILFCLHLVVTKWNPESLHLHHNIWSFFIQRISRRKFPFFNQCIMSAVVWRKVLWVLFVIFSTKILWKTPENNYFIHINTLGHTPLNQWLCAHFYYAHIGLLARGLTARYDAY